MFSKMSVIAFTAGLVANLCVTDVNAQTATPTAAPNVAPTAALSCTSGPCDCSSFPILSDIPGYCDDYTSGRDWFCDACCLQADCITPRSTSPTAAPNTSSTGSGHTVCKCDSTTPSSEGEALCENHDYISTECKKIGCCSYSSYNEHCHFSYNPNFNSCGADAGAPASAPADAPAGAPAGTIVCTVSTDSMCTFADENKAQFCALEWYVDNCRLECGRCQAKPSDGSNGDTTTTTVAITTDNDATCVWVKNNYNSNNEVEAHPAASKEECIANVREKCPTATIANYQVGGNQCFCQFGNNMNLDPFAKWENCLLAQAVAVDNNNAVDNNGNGNGNGNGVVIDQVKSGFMAAIAAAKQLYASQGCSRRGRRDVGGCLNSCGCAKSITDTSKASCYTACVGTDYTKAAANGQAVAAFTTKCLQSGGVTAGTGANTATVDPCVALKQGIATAEANLAAYTASSAATATASLAVAAAAAATMLF